MTNLLKQDRQIIEIHIYIHQGVSNNTVKSQCIHQWNRSIDTNKYWYCKKCGKIESLFYNYKN